MISTTDWFLDALADFDGDGRLDAVIESFDPPGHPRTLVIASIPRFGP